MVHLVDATDLIDAIDEETEEEDARWLDEEGARWLHKDVTWEESGERN